jgi:hypothetical protein
MEKININGKEFNLNTARAYELGVLTPVEPPFVNPRYGNVYSHSGQQYLLASVSFNELLLIQIDGCIRGQRYTEAVKVEKIECVTKTEWNELTGNNPHSFNIIYYHYEDRFIPD